MIKISDKSWEDIEQLVLRMIATLSYKRPILERDIFDLLKVFRRENISLNAAGELVQGEADNWLPIDMARKTFEPTLLYDPINGISIGCWWSDRDGFEDDGGLGISPTHWMPLPEAPK